MKSESTREGEKEIVQNPILSFIFLKHLQTSNDLSSVFFLVQIAKFYLLVPCGQAQNNSLKKHNFCRKLITGFH